MQFFLIFKICSFHIENIVFKQAQHTHTHTELKHLFQTEILTD